GVPPPGLSNEGYAPLSPTAASGGVLFPRRKSTQKGASPLRAGAFSVHFWAAKREPRGPGLGKPWGHPRGLGAISPVSGQEGLQIFIGKSRLEGQADAPGQNGGQLPDLPVDAVGGDKEFAAPAAKGGAVLRGLPCLLQDVDRH